MKPVTISPISPATMLLTVFCPEMRRPQCPKSSNAAYQIFKKTHDKLLFRSFLLSSICYTFTAATLGALIIKASPLVAISLAINSVVFSIAWYKWGNQLAQHTQQVLHYIYKGKEREAINCINLGANIFDWSYFAPAIILPFFRIGMFSFGSRSLLAVVAGESCSQVLHHLLSISKYPEWEFYRALMEASTDEIAKQLIEAGANVNWKMVNVGDKNWRGRNSILFTHLSKLRHLLSNKNPQEKIDNQIKLIEFLLDQGAKFHESEDEKKRLIESIVQRYPQVSPIISSL